MILDLTKTEELCKKLREVTGKAVSVDYEFFLHKSGNESTSYRIYIEDDEHLRMSTMGKLNSWLEYTIEYQQKIKELTHD
jgi:hypothetical protein